MWMIQVHRMFDNGFTAGHEVVGQYYSRWRWLCRMKLFWGSIFDVRSGDTITEEHTK